MGKNYQNPLFLKSDIPAKSGLFNLEFFKCPANDIFMRRSRLGGGEQPLSACQSVIE
jgi:hypothetical protein